MKILNINRYLAPGMLLVALLFQACSSDETYDVVGNPDNLVYFRTIGDAVTTCTVTHTPAGEFGEVKASFNVAIQRAANCNTTVTAVVDNSLVADYNEAHNTDYKTVPDGLVEATKLTVTIEKDTVGSKDPVEVSIPSSAFDKLTEEAYLLPVRLDAVNGDGKASGQRGIAYVVIKTQTKMVNANVSVADMPGSLMTDYSGITASYTAGGTVDDIVQLFDGDVTNGTALRTDENDGKGTTLVFNLGKQTNVAGMRMARYYKDWYGWWAEEYYFSNVVVSSSTDGTTWTELASVNESEMTKSGGYQYLAFYGAVQMNYLKLKFTSGSSSVSSLAELGLYTK